MCSNISLYTHTKSARVYLIMFSRDWYGLRNLLASICEVSQCEGVEEIENSSAAGAWRNGRSRTRIQANFLISDIFFIRLLIEMLLDWQWSKWIDCLGRISECKLPHSSRSQREKKNRWMPFIIIKSLFQCVKVSCNHLLQIYAEKASAHMG